MALHSLQGTRGAYLSGRFDGEDPVVWLDGVSKGVSPANFRYKNMARPESYTEQEHPEWQPLWDLRNQFEHDYWKQFGDEAIQAGHGGGDYFVIYDFVRAVSGEIDPPIDVYDAVTWSSILLNTFKRPSRPEKNHIVCIGAYNPIGACACGIFTRGYHIDMFSPVKVTFCQFCDHVVAGCFQYEL